MSDSNVKIPRSKFESLVEMGLVFEAAILHGRAYFISGTVVDGRRIGRTLGYPTANVLPAQPNVVIPAQGVYAAYARLKGAWHESMVNIGIRPTLNLDHETIEAHLFGFDKQIYNQFISLHFIQRLRDEMRFASLAELKHQLDLDGLKAAKIFKELAINPLPSNDFIFIDHEGFSN